jgi:hypothetical protein
MVDLDGGGEVQLIRQNTEGPAEHAGTLQGREVTVGWRPEHTVAVREREMTKEGSP